jgi:hypothetical protein
MQKQKAEATEGTGATNVSFKQAQIAGAVVYLCVGAADCAGASHALGPRVPVCVNCGSNAGSIVLPSMPETSL